MQDFLVKLFCEKKGMPIITTNKTVQFGKTGKKYPFKPGNPRSKKEARRKALTQMRAIEWSKHSKPGMK